MSDPEDDTSVAPENGDKPAPAGAIGATKEAGYRLIIQKIFDDHYSEGMQEFSFSRREIVAARNLVAPVLEDLNPGDVLYTFRYRRRLPDKILATQPPDMVWAIIGSGRGKYLFRLVNLSRVLPRADLATIDIPDATPEMIRKYALDDEQALLAILRYNRLIDIFLGVTTYSLQNHLRSHVKGMGQIEIDELYFGIDKHGCHYAIPVQAKVGKDQIGIGQTQQDFAWVEQKFPGMRCRAIAAQFVAKDRVAIFELTLQEGQLRIVDEKHYKLVPASQLDDAEIIKYR